MWQRLILGFLLAIAAFFVVRAFSSESFTNWDSVVETPASAPIIREPMPKGDMIVASGGPNPPNAAPRPNMPKTRSPEPEASDPYAETAEDSEAPEHLRHPERSFSPGVIPEQTNINQAAGLAGAPATSSQVFQTFSPEFVQNGGNFFQGISAMEDENPNYSAF
jgi:hypothetical protein